LKKNYKNDGTDANVTRKCMLPGKKLPNTSVVGIVKLRKKQER